MNNTDMDRLMAAIALLPEMRSYLNDKAPWRYSTTDMETIIAALEACKPMLTMGNEAVVERNEGIYTASKTIHAPMWKQWRNEGLPIISTWIDEAGAGESKDLSDLWRRCISEASKAKVLIAYRQEGEILKGTFIEIGAALHAGIRVICVGDFSGMSFLHHPLVEQMDMTSARAALAALNHREGE